MKAQKLFRLGGGGEVNTTSPYNGYGSKGNQDCLKVITEVPEGIIHGYPPIKVKT